jgi:DNA-binding NarL/FixJ family response regulator
MILAFRLRLSLTSRQVEILRLVAEGLTNKQIAAELYIEVETVKGHLTHAMHKLGAMNRVEAILLGHNAGVISLPDCAARFAERLEQRAA